MEKVYSIDVKEQFIEMKANEYSFSSISEELKVSKPTLIDWSKEFKMDIENCRSLEIKALQEKKLLFGENGWRYIMNSLSECEPS